MPKKALQGNGHTIPSLFVRLPFDRFNTALVYEIIKFLGDHTSPDQSPKYVVKLPFVTNSEGIKFPTSFPQVFDALLIASKKFAIENNRISYAIVQPCLINRKEKKCVMLNGRFHHFAKNHVKSSPQSKFAEDDELKKVAETYLEELVLRCPGTIASGLVRVDLMSYNGSIVVNEFESLEAMYCPENPHRDSDNESKAYCFLVNYWTDIISNRVLKHII